MSKLFLDPVHVFCSAPYSFHDLKIGEPEFTKYFYHSLEVIYIMRIKL